MVRKVILRNFTEIAASRSVSFHVETLFILSYICDHEVEIAMAGYWGARNLVIGRTGKMYASKHFLTYGDEGKTELAYEVERIF
jgi:hypothetical protein